MSEYPKSIKDAVNEFVDALCVEASISRAAAQRLAWDFVETIQQAQEARDA